MFSIDSRIGAKSLKMLKNANLDIAIEIKQHKYRGINFLHNIPLGIVTHHPNWTIIRFHDGDPT
jgi:hypothetical protein